MQKWFEERWRKVRESKNMVEWWEAVGKSRIRRKRTEANITKEQWVQHFSNLLGARQIGTEDEQTIMKRGGSERRRRVGGQRTGSRNQPGRVEKGVKKYQK